MGRSVVRLLARQLAGPREPAGRRRRDPPARDLRPARRAAATRSRCSARGFAGRPPPHDARRHRRPPRRHAVLVSASRRWPYWRRALASRDPTSSIEDINKIPLVHAAVGRPADRRARPSSLRRDRFPGAPRPSPPPCGWPSVRWAGSIAAFPFRPVSESTRRRPRGARHPSGCNHASSTPASTSRRSPPTRPRARATPRFAYLGRLKRYKRIDLILRAFAASRASHRHARDRGHRRRSPAPRAARALA